MVLPIDLKLLSDSAVAVPDIPEQTQVLSLAPSKHRPEQYLIEQNRPPRGSAAALAEIANSTIEQKR
jgi:hypothetical protein